MKTIVTYVSVLLLVIGASASVFAAEITAHCVGDGTVAVRARFWASELSPDWQGVVVERSEVGICNSGHILTDPPLQLLDGYDMGDHQLSYAVPSPTTSYRYALKGLTALGDLVDLSGDAYAPTWFAVESCSGDALLVRGLLRDVGMFGRVGIEICAGYCWDICTVSPMVGVIDLDPGEYEPYVGTDTVVDVFGAWDNGPPEWSWGCVSATRISAGKDCSGTVAAEQSNWGTVKAWYR